MDQGGYMDVWMYYYLQKKNLVIGYAHLHVDKCTF